MPTPFTPRPDFTPCPTCEQKNGCTNLRHCNRPRSIEYSMRRVQEAAKAWDAAGHVYEQELAALVTTFASELALSAELAIEKGQQG